MAKLQTEDLQTFIPERDADPAYREVSGLAVTGLVCGAASSLAMAQPEYWLVPLIAAAINCAALRRIQQRPQQLIGRRAALAGLALALIFGFSAPLQEPIHRWRLRTEAVELARQWFVALRENEPQTAHQLALPQWLRMPADETLVTRYAEGSGPRALQQYVDQPAVGMLLKLGKYAHIRYFGNLSLSLGEEQETLEDIYAVTVEQGGQRTSFFVKLKLARRLDLLRRAWSWQVSTVEFMPGAPAQLASAG